MPKVIYTIRLSLYTETGETINEYFFTFISKLSALDHITKSLKFFEDSPTFIRGVRAIERFSNVEEYVLAD